uniref:4-hydroxy-tetrahydrodipicolinate reductase n=1 Tax=Fagus sylvatica TaxID=28930 RepID=A0A2N9EQ15_FAGSY
MTSLLKVNHQQHHLVFFSAGIRPNNTAFHRRSSVISMSSGSATPIQNLHETASSSSHQNLGIPIMVNGCTGKMGKAVIKAADSAGLNIVPLSFGSAEETGQTVQVSGKDILLHGAADRENVLASVFDQHPNLVVVDYTVPSAVNDNAELYCKIGVPFVMGTTGGDRDRLYKTVEDSKVYAVISPQMGKQVVAFLAAMDIMAEQFPGAFSGYSLQVSLSLNLEIFLGSEALLGKWLWRYATEREALWRKIVDLKYGSMMGGWCSNAIQGGEWGSFKFLAGSLVWRHTVDASLGKILMIDNLWKRRLVLLDWCYMCKANGESIDHLFLHFSIARDLWSMVLSVFGVWWVMPCHVLALLTCWSSGFKRYKFADIWDLIPHCVMESHQASKVDTSGTAKAVVSCFQKLGVSFDVDEIQMIRDPKPQLEMVGVPEEHLPGHAFHMYHLTSPDQTVSFEFQHNVCGRSIYAEGTVDAVIFLAKKVQSKEDKRIYNMIDVLREGNMR